MTVTPGRKPRLEGLHGRPGRATLRPMSTAIVADFLTNSAYGFPRGSARRIAPKVLAVVHITANMGDAQAQRDYANRDASPGPSAHYYIDRDGGGIHAIDEKRFAAWSNGDLKSPVLTNAGVKYLDALRPTHNANEGCYLEIECVGTATPDGQWTDAQFDTVATLIAAASDDTGLPISATTVLPHAYINTIDRAHCPSLVPAAHMSRLIDLAKGKLAMAGLRFRIVADVAGTVTIAGPGHQIIRVFDSGHVAVPDGEVRETCAKVALLAPLDSYPGDRTNGFLIGKRIGDATNVEAAFVLASDVTFAPVVADCTTEIAAAITADRAKARIVYG